ncbi:MAG: superoxide dismutase [Patescibacteria group bacterium]
MKFELPKLPYPYDALEPHLDAETMQVHYEKHHQAYLDKFNAILEKYPDLQGTPEELLSNLNNLPVDDTDRQIIRNQGGGFVNHNLYWQVIGPEKQVDVALVEEINNEFGSVEEFKKRFSEVAAAHFASGWAWLVFDENKKLKIYTLPNQDSPYALGHSPVLLLDLWEHAYYLKFKNKRADFIEAWWNAVKLI